MDAREFFESAMEPSFQDEMNFQLTSSDPDPERTFSVEGVETILNQIHDFVFARINASWKKTGKAPKNLFAHVKLTFGDKPISQDILEVSLQPWTSWSDSGDGLQVIDASLRADAYKRRN